MLDNLRVLRKPTAKDGGFQNLLDLQHAPEMRVWDKGYDERGFWSIPRARAAAAAERARAAQAGPKKRKQKQKETGLLEGSGAASKKSDEGGDEEEKEGGESPAARRKRMSVSSYTDSDAVVSMK